MYIFLAKKIAIPNGIKLRSLSWNPEQGWLACGGEDKLLKVLKLDVVQSKESNARGVAAQTALSMNQTCEGHQGAVVNTTWNAQYKKLTTSDSSGLIIVWVLHKGVWFEEMINNRGKSVVADMRWRSNGGEICIAYEDGMIIMGGVDGNRLWSKDLGSPIRFVEWAPDGHILLFTMTDGTVNIHSHMGVRLGSVPLAPCTPGSRLVGVEWYDGVEGLASTDQATLALAWSDGRLQLMLDEEDESPILVDSGLAVSVAKWNSNGTVLAVVGTTKAGYAEVHCYSPGGQALTIMRVPGNPPISISSLSWEGGGLRMALAVDAFVYFAAVRPQYRWAFFGDTLAYAYSRPDRAEAVVVFLNAKVDTRQIKYVRGLVGMSGCGEYCMLATRVEVQEPGKEGVEGEEKESGRRRRVKKQTSLIVSNSIGTPLDSRTIDIEPDHLVLGPTHVAVASQSGLYVWQYRMAGQKAGSSQQEAALLGGKRRDGKERIFQIDAEDGSQADAITCLACSETVLLVGRASGSVVRYSLPSVVQEQVYLLRNRPAQLHLNSDNTRFAVVDKSNVLTFFDMPSNEHLATERRDVWDVKWAHDAPDLCAIMEKTRLYVLRGGEPEEPVLSSGYLCAFTDLTITTALLDDVYASPDRPPPVDQVVLEHEVRALRDTRSLLVGSLSSMKDAVSFVADKAHPRLWRLLAECALEQLEFGVAERAFVAVSDYGGLQFVKRLRLQREPAKQRAEVAAYLKRFDEAESAFLACDRKDLALDMRQRMEDWPRVLLLLEKGEGDVEAVRLACQRMGDWCADRQQWRRAVTYHERSGSASSLESLIGLYYLLEDYMALSRLVTRLPPAPQGALALSNLAFKLQTVGLTDSAADAYLNAGDVKSALDCCVAMNQWGRALSLAQEHNLPQVQGLLSKYVGVLLDSGKLIPAVELYRKAGRHGDSAKVLARLAADAVKARPSLLRSKKLFVLSALEVQRHRAGMLPTAVATGPGSTVGSSVAGTMAKTGTTRGTAMTSVAATLATLTRMDAESAGSEHPASAKALDAAWHGAEGVHLLMMAQRQLFSGDPAAALITSGFLAGYEDVVDPVSICAITALAGYYSQAFGAVSRALSRLAHADGLTAGDREAVQTIAVSIFTRNRPTNPPSMAQPAFSCPSCKAGNRSTATSCAGCSVNFSPCIATGRPLGGGDIISCGSCKHRAYVSAVRGRKCCPLCHAKHG